MPSSGPVRIFEREVKDTIKSPGERGFARNLGWERAVVCFRDIRIAADSTMLRMVNLLIALSLGVHLEQLEHRIGFT